MTLTREPLQVVEIVQPKCSRVFGSDPCLATGSKCWNTDATCKFRTALDLSDEILLRFVKPAANRVLGSGYEPSTAIPALLAVDTAPTILNVGSGNDNLSPLGIRAVATVAIKDFPYNDVGLDPYLSSRSYDVEARGSFWTKWLARNPFHVGYILRIYDGFFGDDLSAMIKREYSIDKIDASRSQIKITAKDILRKLTDTKAKAPALSPGSLSLALADSEVVSFQAVGAVLADYPASGWVRIGSEIISYASRALDGSNVEFTISARGALNTEVASHSQFSLVQRVLSYEAQPFTDIIYDLLTAHGVDLSAYITKVDWDDEFYEWRELYNFTAYLTQPIEIDRLVGELCQQALSNIWWDERVQKIILRAQRPNFAPHLITQDGHIVADSVSIQEVPKDRASQVYVYYGLRNPTLKIDDRISFANAVAFIDVDKEAQYGEPAVKEIFCRWINTSVIAQSLAGAYLQRFKDVRQHITFNLTPKDLANFWTGDVVNINHFMYVDFTGQERERSWLITSAETVQQGGVYRFMAEDNESGGLLWEWVADDDTRPSTTIGAWVDANSEDGSGNILPFAWL